MTSRSLVALVFAVLTVSSVAQSQEGHHLTISPSTAAPGQQVLFEYCGPLAGQGLSHLVLRADVTFNTTPEMMRTGPIAHLIPHNDCYRATYTTPENFLLVLPAVEDSAALVSAYDYSWALMRRQEDGSNQPSATARRTHIRAIVPEDKLHAAELVRALRRDHPTDPRSLQMRWVLDEFVTKAEADSMKSADSVSMAGLDRRMRIRPHTDSVVGLAYWALNNKRPAMLTNWLLWLQRNNPSINPTLHLETMWYWGLPRGDSIAQLQTLENLWERRSVGGWYIGNDNGQLLFSGFQNAVRTGQLGEIVRWADRWESLEGWGARHALVFYTLQNPLTRGFALSRAPVLLEHQRRTLEISGLTTRPFNMTQPEYDWLIAWRLANLGGQIARAMIEEGDTVGALGYINATEGAWNPELELIAGQLWLSIGDTARGLAHLGRVAADPFSAPRFGDSISALLPSNSSAEWQREMESGRQRFRQMVGSDRWRSSVPVEGSPAVYDDSTGTTIPFVREGEVTIAIRWSPYCFPSLRDLREFRNARTVAERYGIRFLPYYTDTPDDAVRSAARQHGFAMLQDTARAHLGLHVTRTPDYSVLVGDQIVFRAPSVRDAVRMAVVAQIEKELRQR